MLETIGVSRSEAELSIQRFRQHDERALQDEYQFRDDEQKLIQSAQQTARELDRLFASDESERVEGA